MFADCNEVGRCFYGGCVSSKSDCDDCFVAGRRCTSGHLLSILPSSDQMACLEECRVWNEDDNTTTTTNGCGFVSYDRRAGLCHFFEDCAEMDGFWADFETAELKNCIGMD